MSFKGKLAECPHSWSVATIAMQCHISNYSAAVWKLPLDREDADALPSSCSKPRPAIRGAPGDIRYWSCFRQKASRAKLWLRVGLLQLHDQWRTTYSRIAWASLRRRINAHRVKRPSSIVAKSIRQTSKGQVETHSTLEIEARTQARSLTRSHLYVLDDQEAISCAICHEGEQWQLRRPIALQRDSAVSREQRHEVESRAVQASIILCVSNAFVPLLDVNRLRFETHQPCEAFSLASNLEVTARRTDAALCDAQHCLSACLMLLMTRSSLSMPTPACLSVQQKLNFALLRTLLEFYTLRRPFDVGNMLQRACRGGSKLCIWLIVGIGRSQSLR